MELESDGDPARAISVDYIRIWALRLSQENVMVRLRAELWFIGDSEIIVDQAVPPKRTHAEIVRRRLTFPVEDHF